MLVKFENNLVSIPNLKIKGHNRVDINKKSKIKNVNKTGGEQNGSISKN